MLKKKNVNAVNCIFLSLIHIQIKLSKMLIIGPLFNKGNYDLILRQQLFFCFVYVVEYCYTFHISLKALP